MVRLFVIYLVPFLNFGNFLLGINVTGDSLNTDVAYRPEAIECPSDEIITTRYKCHVRGQWIDCFRRHCCANYTYISGRCISNDRDPCSIGICEQKCSIYFGRITCSCFHGFRLDDERQKKGIKPYCTDVDECAVGNGGCEHFCNNTIGSYHCACKNGYKLHPDNKTCEAINADVHTLPVITSKCVANCEVVSRLETRIQELEEKLQAITTALQLHNFGSGPPGPEGNPGPPGSQGPRGFPGPQGPRGECTTGTAENPSEQGNLEKGDIGDWTLVQVGGRKKSCVCKRGPVGPPGAEGKTGPKGSKGDPGIKGDKGQEGSFDFLLLVLADVRHDIEVLQETVFQRQSVPSYDISAAMQKQFTQKPEKYVL